MAQHDYDRFRSWTLTALYGSIGLLSLMLILGAFRLWPSVNDGHFPVLSMVVCGAAAAFFSASSAIRFFNAAKQGAATPPLALMPFFSLTLTIIAFSFVTKSLS